jgi:hypothetical protein
MQNIAIGQPGQIAKDVNRVVKVHRGTSRPFLMILVEDNGTATELMLRERALIT